MSGSSLTLRSARWSAEHPWRAVLIWLLFVAAAIGIGSTFSTVSPSEADYRVGDSGLADQLVHDHGLAPVPTETVLITSRSGSGTPVDAAKAAAALRTGMSRLPAVARVEQPVWSANHEGLLVPVVLRSHADDPDVTSLQAVTAAVQTHYPGLQVAEAGQSSLNSAVGDRVGHDLGQAEHLSLPITLLIMLFAFGALIAAGLPVLLAITAVLATIGLLAPLSHLIPSESTVSSMVLLIGMAVGVDYSLFYLKRAREERRKGADSLDAVEIAAATSGHSIVVSGLAVIVSMAGLYMTRNVTFQSLASGAIMVVAVAVIGSLTVLPGLMAKLGRWVDRPRIPFLGKAMEKRPSGSISRRLVGPVVRRPVAALLVAGAVVLGLALPALSMKMHDANLDTLPQDITEVQTMHRINDLFPSQNDTIQVVVQAPASAQARVHDALTSLDATAGHDARLFVADATAPIQVSRDHTVSVLTLSTRGEAGDALSDEALNTARDTLGPRYLDSVTTADGSRWVLGGDVATSVDIASAEKHALPLVIGFVLALTLLMMGITFRSIPIALVTTALNLASVGAAFGVLTLVFQHSWANGLLGYTSSGFVVDWIPLFMFVVLMGLSMDYHVFVLSRVREGVRRGLPPKVAVEAGVSQTAGVVTSAAAVMVSVFAIFASLSMLEMKQLGVGLAVAVFIDATLVRVILLPAALSLLGRWAWFPGRIGKPNTTRVMAPEPQRVPEPAGR